MKKGFYIRDNRLLVQGDRLLLVLTPKEVIDSILNDKELFAKACKRGKSELRYQQNEQRMQKEEERIAQQMQASEAEQMNNISEKW